MAVLTSTTHIHSGLHALLTGLGLDTETESKLTQKGEKENQLRTPKGGNTLRNVIDKIENILRNGYLCLHCRFLQVGQETKLKWKM